METASRISDEDLMARVQGGDVVAFAELYGRYRQTALRATRVICRDRGRAEDAAQDGFFSIWRSRADYRVQRGAFGAWAMKIVRNRAIDALRAEEGRPHLPEEGAREDASRPAEAPSPQEVATAAFERARMFEALRRLPRSQAEAIALRFYGDLSDKQIASGLGIPVATAKSRVRLGLEKLAGGLAVE
jgi:RNA polymerase sigma-70 factor, ECF subfamily